ncbi:uncharacterized protein KY384_004880 [Bacidia gigantensis]|uniref:uncharacterized protein n=1 Tax=Bacidia gigantensis TaxID=2732470 RepID=UPI001D03D7B6|nr:uncharacterized protein KY384_004880 [Bacidia gigantensis]KAG8530378.1 hypothetical protein KY384_004880 [Bacidia gigantensis]
MGTPDAAISAAKAATSSHDQDSGKKERWGSISPPGHRRSISGSLSASLGLLRTNSSPDHAHKSETKSEMVSPIMEEPPSPRTGSAMASAVQQQRKTRTRKGSLRKSALLGTSKLRMENKDRRATSSTLDEVQALDRQQVDGLGTYFGATNASISPLTPLDLPSPKPLPVPPPVPMVTHPVHGDPSKILEVTDADEPFPDLRRPLTTKSSTTASTLTDDDESLISPTDLIPPSLQQLPLPNDSYFPSQPPRSRSPRSASKPRSPLAALPPATPASPPSEWDYSETSWWGWIILCVTWLVFVVGMGSCFGVWSWAWDVGATPYAPPDLEDDPTLPIVGYYPALMVLTCVMAWVWVTIAWVGMKYFRHANIVGEDE